MLVAKTIKKCWNHHNKWNLATRYREKRAKNLLITVEIVEFE